MDPGAPRLYFTMLDKKHRTVLCISVQTFLTILMSNCPLPPIKFVAMSWEISVHTGLAM